VNRQVAITGITALGKNNKLSKTGIVNHSVQNMFFTSKSIPRSRLVACNGANPKRVATVNCSAMQGGLCTLRRINDDALIKWCGHDNIDVLLIANVFLV
jgi:acyl-[acyl carrier protein]--UDP-N-acetylglucosamine O-acyltransferase